MNAKKRYFSLFILTLILFTFLYIYKTRRKPLKNQKIKTSLQSPSFIGLQEIQELEFIAKDSEFRFERSCRMETCFNFDKCKKQFKVYIYPSHDDLTPSNSYKKIIQTIKESNLWTEDPAEACLFVLSLDTLDRDPLSQDFIRNMQFRNQNCKPIKLKKNSPS